MKNLFFTTLLMLCGFVALAQNDQKTTPKVIEGEFAINHSKATEGFFKEINDEIYQLKYIDYDKSKNTYYLSGSVSVYYKDTRGVANSGFTIGNDHAITSNSEKTESGGYFMFNLAIKINGNKAQYTYSNFVHRGTGPIGNGGPIEGYPECGSEKIGGIPNWNSFKQQADTECERIANKLKSMLQ
ncbi:MAG: hypothetical protein IT238_08375 [Bacteroidia bacterium]|nr:hypothetical protein [Bacteroidia bacterium]MCZ2248605.1 hypothetical protein [Bacteroidia bacterium]